MGKPPAQRHPLCEDRQCAECLDDASLLHAWLDEQLPDLKRHDLLAMIHSWLLRNGYRHEVNGWPSPETYDPTVLDLFIKDPHGGPKVRAMEVTNRKLAAHDALVAACEMVARQPRQCSDSPYMRDKAMVTFTHEQLDQVVAALALATKEQP